MSDFFSSEVGLESGLISYYIFPLLLLVSANFIIFWKRDKIAANDRLDKVLRYGIVTLALALEIMFHLWVLFDLSDWSIKRYLSYEMIALQGCAVALWLMCFSAVFNNEKVFKLSFYLAFLGATLALLFPGVEYGVDRFRYWHYFIVHISFLTLAIYMLAVKKVDVEAGQWKKATLFMVGYGLLALAINLIFGTSYLYLWNSKGTPLDGVHESWLWKLATIPLLAVIMVIYFYVLEKVILKIKDRVKKV